MAHIKSFEEYSINENQQIQSTILSEIEDGEIKFYPKRLNNILSFIGEGGIDWESFQEDFKAGSVWFQFNENADGRISPKQWMEIENTLSSYENVNGITNIIINPNKNMVTIDFDVEDYVLGIYY